MVVDLVGNKLTTRELVYWMKLANVPYLGPVKITRLLSSFKTVENVFSASQRELLDSRIFTPPMIQELEKLKNASEENFLKVIDTCKQNNFEIATLLDESYPNRLKNISSPPLTLFFWGNTKTLATEKTFAIAGSRSADQNGLDFSFNCAKKLGDAGFTIVSGGAQGIDAAAHKGALESKLGKTIAVLGSGFFHLYPEENSALFEAIRANGVLVSEYSPNFKGSRLSYLQRNRITSGLSEGLLLCASNEKGGSETQLKTAHSQRVPLFCPDASLNIQPNAGIIAAVEKYGAKPVRDASEIMRALEAIKKPVGLTAFS